MISSLRYGHLQIWRLWAILLPLGVVAGWMAIPKDRDQNLLQASTEQALPVVLGKHTNEKYSVSLRSTSDTSALQLEWTNTATLTYPSAVVYKQRVSEQNINHATLVGRIEGRGIYRFVVDSSFAPVHFRDYNLVLYDFIHQQVIDVIHF